jgi:DNA-binding transcriptional LysR family regulator
LLTQALARFACQYPEVDLAIEVTDRWIDVSQEPFDVAIHVGRIRNRSLPARRLASLARGVYASPTYLARNGVPELPKDLLRHDCIVMESQLANGLWNFRSGEAGGSVTVTPRVRVTDIVIAREMAAAGVGVAMLTHATCTAEVRAGILVQVLSDWSLPTVPIFATFLERRHLPRRIRAFLDLIGEAIRREPNVEGQ